MDIQHVQKCGLMVVTRREFYIPPFHEKKENNKEEKQTPKRNLNMREMIRRKKYVVHVLVVRVYEMQ